MQRLKSIQSYEYIAFITGFALMTYELVASRILAPTIGSSIYVWTSVIGVIIAALSLGYKTGGILADRRVEPMDISRLLQASAGAVLLTILGAQSVLAVATSITDDARMQGFIASVWLFMPTSFLLGMISPYLARLKNISLKTTGTTIASLSALNSMGSVAGTFITGFVLFAYIGAQESLLLVSAVLFASSWIVQPKQNLKERFKVTLLLLALVIVTVITVRSPLVVAIIDTPSSSYRVMDMDYIGQPIRALSAGPGGIQSGIYRNGSKELIFSYTRKMAELVDQAPLKDRILILGGGAFTLPQYLAEKHPTAKIDVVEIDPELLTIARQYFNYKDPAQVSVIAKDARVFLNGNTEQYDIVLVDVYSDTLIPFSLSTVEYTDRLNRAVKAHGIVVANIIGSNKPACYELMTAMHKSYAQKFPFHKIIPLGNSNLKTSQNIIAIYSQKKHDWLSYLASSVTLPDGRTLTDNFAPVEHIKQQCLANN